MAQLSLWLEQLILGLEIYPTDKMTAPKKHKDAWKAIARCLLYSRSKNVLLTCQQVSEAFNNCITLGGGVGLTAEIVKKAFATRGGGGEYTMPCNVMGLGYEGSCILGVVTSFQPRRGGDRCFAVGVFDSGELFQSAVQERNELDDQHVGRMQFKLTNELKSNLVDYLATLYPTDSIIDRQVASPEPPRRISTDSEPKDQSSELSLSAGEDEERDELDSFVNDGGFSSLMRDSPRAKEPVDPIARRNQLKQELKEMNRQLAQIEARYRSIRQELTQEHGQPEVQSQSSNGQASKTQIQARRRRMRRSMC